MERAFYFWTGLVVTGFFGFFAVWTYGDAEPGRSHSALFWFTVVGAGVGAVLLLIAVIATAVGVAVREHAGPERD